MIAYIQGKILSVNGFNVTFLTSGGVGYEVYCSAGALYKIADKQEGEVYTYMAITQDGVSLYGFESIEEKSMFLKLISVSGVGPKMGITVLSGLNLRDLAIAIAGSDVKTLSTIKGLGKKTAERIILELRENISSLDLPEDAKKTTKQQPTVKVVDELNEDAVIALMSLGFNRAESVKRVESAREQGANKLEDVITFALRG